MRALRDERGAIFAISAVAIPVILLLTALVLDVGRWYTHKRALQNRADAGALAAGYEYLARLPQCTSSPGSANAAIRDAARLYAGAGPGGYNETVNDQSRVTVTVNDGANDPCQTQADGGIWTDVVVKETDIGTVAGTFGLSLPSITARARVELSQITGLAGGQPFVTETGVPRALLGIRAYDGGLLLASNGGVIALGEGEPLFHAVPNGRDPMRLVRVGARSGADPGKAEGAVVALSGPNAWIWQGGSFRVIDLREF